MMNSAPEQLPRTWRFASDPAKVAAVRRDVEAAAASVGFDQRACDEIGLCVNEALANVIRHAYLGKTDEPIELTLSFDSSDERFTIKIRDWSSVPAPTSLPKKVAHPDEPGGLGLVCLRRLMEEVTFEDLSPGTILTMTRKR